MAQAQATDTQASDPRMAQNARRVLAAYRGVALSLTITDPKTQASLWQVTLVHADHSLNLPLASAADDSEIIADWRALASQYNLPALLEVAPGQYEVTPDSRVGVGANPCPLARRGGSAVRTRRARFLVRRQVGDPSRAATSYKGAREMIARN